MKQSKNRSVYILVIASLFALLAISCAPKGKNAVADSSPPPMAPDTAYIESIEVTPTGNGAEVVINTSKPISPVGYLLQDPQRVIVDVRDAKLGAKVSSSYPVSSGVVKEVHVATVDANGGSVARITVKLDADADFEINREDNKVVVKVKSRAAATNVSSTGADTASATVVPGLPAETATEIPSETPVKVSSGNGSVTEAAAIESGDVGEVGASASTGFDSDSSAASLATDSRMAPPGVSLKPASKILNIKAATEKKIVKIIVEADGAINGFDAFTLPTPPRIVVDISNLTTAYPVTRLDVGRGDVSSVRMGKHPDKVRIVIDLNRGLVPYSTLKDGDSLIIFIGEGAEDMVPAPSAPVVIPISVPATSTPSEKSPPSPAYMPAESAPDVSAGATPGLPNDSGDSGSGDAGIWGPSEQPSTVPSKPSETPPAVSAAPPELPTEAAPPMAGASASAPGESFDAVEVTAVEFDWTSEKSKIRIATSGRAKYEVVSNDRDRLLSIRIVNAKIPAQLERSLDTQEFSSPVRMVSSYQWGTAELKDVYVTMSLNFTPEYYVIRDGSDILVIFNNPKSGQVAAMSHPAEYAAGPGGGASPAIEDEEPITEEGAGRGGEQFYGGVGGSVRKSFTGRLVYLDYQKISIVDALSLLAEVAGLNLVVDDDIKGTISLKLEAVAWDQALDIILRTQGCGGVIRGNILRVSKKEKIEDEQKELDARRKRKQSVEPLQLRILFVSYAKPGDVATKIQSLLTPVRGRVVVDARTSSLLIWDVQKKLDEIESLVRRLDVETPQVLIEARIVEARTSFSKNMGVNWGMGYHRGASYGSTTGLNFPGTVDVGVGLIQGIAGAAGTAATATGNTVGLTLGSLTGAMDLDLILRASELENDAKVISSPRILTLDNQSATITQGTAIPFATTSAAGTQTQFIDANLKIDVTPHVTSDGRIAMELTVQNNTPDYTVVGAGGPGINKSEAKTQILVKDGETMVIGGIYVHDTGGSQNRTPYLGKLPFIGWLFRESAYGESKRELLIFLTPRVVSGGEQYLRSIQSTTTTR